MTDTTPRLPRPLGASTARLDNAYEMDVGVIGAVESPSRGRFVLRVGTVAAGFDYWEQTSIVAMDRADAEVLRDVLDALLAADAREA